MSHQRLRDLLNLLASIILYGGLVIGAIMFVVSLGMSLSGAGSRPHWGVSAGATVVLMLQALLVGGALKVLIRIDERLERLEGPRPGPGDGALRAPGTALTGSDSDASEPFARPAAKSLFGEPREG